MHKLKLNIIKEPITQSWSIKDICEKARPYTWENIFEESVNEIEHISNMLDEQEKLYGTYYPLKKDIFNAFHLTPLPSVKIVIFGQDPYYQTISINGETLPRAVGLSFSVRREDSIPASLKTIYNELTNTVRGFVAPDHGDLTEWAQQGVLLINSCLTVRPNAAGSHDVLWHDFLKRICKAISYVNPYCIYFLWGQYAQSLKSLLGEKSIILEAAHPSPRSATRGFYGCNHFNLANEILIKHGKTPIDWRLTLKKDYNNPAPQISQPRSVVPLTQPLPIVKSRLYDPPSSSSKTITDIPRCLPVIPNTIQQQSTDVSTSPVGGSVLTSLLPPKLSSPPKSTIASVPETPPSTSSSISSLKIDIPIIPKINFGLPI